MCVFTVKTCFKRKLAFQPSIVFFVSHLLHLLTSLPHLLTPNTDADAACIVHVFACAVAVVAVYADAACIVPVFACAVAVYADAAYIVHMCCFCSILYCAC